MCVLLFFPLFITITSKAFQPSLDLDTISITTNITGYHILQPVITTNIHVEDINKKDPDNINVNTNINGHHVLNSLTKTNIYGEVITKEAAEENIRFENLISRQEGRHFLLTTLLEKNYEPLSSPRYQNKIVFQLPSTLGGTLAPNAHGCCQLESVPSGSGNLSIRDVQSYLQREGLLKLKRDLPLNDFSTEAKKMVTKLANFINSDKSEERPFSHMLSMAAVVKDLVNQDLFAKAVVTVMLRRSDVGNAAPPAAEIVGTAFFPRKTKEVVDRLPTKLKNVHDVEKEIVIDWSDPEYATYPDSEPEKQLWYIREDPEMNSHHWFWHILFGDSEFYSKDELQHRRGELFWYLHNQVCNRYNMERLSNGMDLVEPFAPQHWDDPIPLGYDSKLGDTTAYYYAPRRDNVRWTGGRDTTIEMKRRASEISKAIQLGYLTDPEGGKVALNYKQGRDLGIIPLGATVETDPVRTVNNETYGDLHNGGHVFMATAGFHKKLIEAGIQSVIGSTATECRDPLLYRWHAYIDGVFAEYKLKLPKYGNKELSFKGISIKNFGVYSYHDDINSNNGQMVKRNELFTHMDNGDVGYFGLDGVETHDQKIRVKYKRLNHTPFNYRFTVKNSGRRAKGMVRIFLAADVGTPTMIEMDKFIWTFKRGTNRFERSFNDSSSVPRRERGLYEIQDLSLNATNSQQGGSEILEYSGCGWPKHLLVPKGNPSGFHANLIVVVSELLKNDAARTTDWETVSGLSHSLCGAPGAKFPDSRPMGFPFDRYRGFQDIIKGRSNMKKADITIYHREECDIDLDCLDGHGCNTELRRCNSKLLSDQALCLTISGPSRGQPCVFPFTIGMRTHANCAVWRWGGKHKGKLWCSTKTDSNGRHIYEQGNVGFCPRSPSCTGLKPGIH